MSLSSIATDLFKPALDEEAFFRAIERHDDKNDKYAAKILKYYPDIANRLNAEGRSPLNIAADVHNAVVAKLLLDAGANIEHEDPKMHMRPLHRALHTNYTGLASLLIDRGADVNARDGNGSSGGSNNPGQTSLYLAVSECPEMILKKLVSAGAQVNVYCDDTTPLMLAVMADNYNPNMPNIKYLISAGADIGMAKPSNGVTADQLAQNSETKKYLHQLQQKNDAQSAAIAKAKADMDAIRAAEQQKLQEKAAAAETIDSLTSGAKNAVTIRKPLRLVRNRQS
ncbi:MAG: hypothetical protein EPN97_15930 [Alphaproteobacteria bacterium]|nr:MAG: hypothetical protein EPN97_15930 [Alphaproteobacteria bacterium]